MFFNWLGLFLRICILETYSICTQWPPKKLKIKYKHPKNAPLLKVVWDDYVKRRVREGPSGTVAQPNSGHDLKRVVTSAKFLTVTWVCLEQR
jgi:hypothetical protein